MMVLSMVNEQTIIMINNPHNKDTLLKDAHSEALVIIAEANIAIYSDRLVQYTPNNKTISALNTTILSVKDSQPNDRIVYFKSDLAFKINQNKRTVSFIKIVNEKLELEFAVEKASQMSESCAKSALRKSSKLLGNSAKEPPPKCTSSKDPPTKDCSQRRSQKLFSELDQLESELKENEHTKNAMVNELKSQYQIELQASRGRTGHLQVEQQKSEIDSEKILEQRECGSNT